MWSNGQMKRNTHRQTKAMRERSVMDMSDRLTIMLMSSLLWKTSSPTPPSVSGSAVLITAEVAACPIGFSVFLCFLLVDQTTSFRYRCTIISLPFSFFCYLLIYDFGGIVSTVASRREVEIQHRTCKRGVVLSVGSLRYGLLLSSQIVIWFSAHHLTQKPRIDLTT